MQLDLPLLSGHVSCEGLRWDRLHSLPPVPPQVANGTLSGLMNLENGLNILLYHARDPIPLTLLLCLGRANQTARNSFRNCPAYPTINLPGRSTRFLAAPYQPSRPQESQQVANSVGIPGQLRRAKDICYPPEQFAPLQLSPSWYNVSNKT